MLNKKRMNSLICNLHKSQGEDKREIHFLQPALSPFFLELSLGLSDISSPGTQKNGGKEECDPEKETLVGKRGVRRDQTCSCFFCPLLSELPPGRTEPLGNGQDGSSTQAAGEGSY